MWPRSQEGADSLFGLPSFLCPVRNCFAAEVGTCMVQKSYPPGDSRYSCDCMHGQLRPRGNTRGGMAETGWPNAWEARHGLVHGMELGGHPLYPLYPACVDLNLRETSGWVGGAPPRGSKVEKWQVSEWGVDHFSERGYAHPSEPTAMRLVMGPPPAKPRKKKSR